VSFTARADGVPVRGAHVVIVGDVKPLPAAGAASSVAPLPAPSPAPSDSTKWL